MSRSTSTWSARITESAWDGPDSHVTFHGWLEREQLRELHRHCHVFLSPVTEERPDDPGGDGGVTDGFPTAAAGEAASSGCLLITANPDADHRALRPGVDHIEIPASDTAFADAVRAVLADPAAALDVAQSGARRVRERLDVRVGAATRLELMGLAPGAEITRGRARRARRASREVSLEPALRRLSGEVGVLSAEVRALCAEESRRDAEHEANLKALRNELVAIGQLGLDDEAATRRLLDTVRAAPELRRAIQGTGAARQRLYSHLYELPRPRGAGDPIGAHAGSPERRGSSRRRRRAAGDRCCDRTAQRTRGCATRTSPSADPIRKIHIADGWWLVLAR